MPPLSPAPPAAAAAAARPSPGGPTRFPERQGNPGLAAGGWGAQLAGVMITGSLPQRAPRSRLEQPPGRRGEGALLQPPAGRTGRPGSPLQPHSPRPQPRPRRDSSPGRRRRRMPTATTRMKAVRMERGEGVSLGNVGFGRGGWAGVMRVGRRWVSSMESPWGMWGLELGWGFEREDLW